MPKPGDGRGAEVVRGIGAAVFSPLGDRIASQPGPVFPLHVGDTWMEPFEGGRMEDLREADLPGLHRYAETAGIAPLREAISGKLRSRGVPCDPEGLLVTAGATSGLSCVIGALADPGEEVLILAPFWPLIRGIVRSWRAVPVEVPFFDRVASAAEAVAAVEARRSSRTVALYFSNPSNPSGRVMPAAWLEALAAWARANDVWLLSDEVYEDFVYRGEHVPSVPFAPERTVSAYSFSKAYGMAGNRAGYLVGPKALVAEAHKIGVHTAYHAPTAAQWAGLRALEGGAAWVAKARALYGGAGAEAAEILGQPAPQGSCFLFLDARQRLDERGTTGFLEDCLEDGVVLAPGSSSGEAYEGWVRLCFTVVPPDDMARAARRLAGRLG